MIKELDKNTLATIVKFQKAEITATKLYKYLAKKEKDPANKSILEEMANAEQAHYDTWKTVSKVEVKPNQLKIIIFKFLSSLLGITFAIKFLEKDETAGIKELLYAQKELGTAKIIVKDEEKHETDLIALLDEERLRYIGSIVLGLNDALVELTGAIAGFTFALAETKTIALTAIITGVAATLSMAASNYQAQKADGNKDALKEAIYTGIAYLVTVALLIFPYFLVNDKFIALALTLVVVIAIILFFSYYVAVTKSVPFFSRFVEMAVITLSITVISYLIGVGAKRFLGLDV